VRIAQIYERQRPVFSFEFFPPHTERGVRTLMRTVSELRELSPDFVSVTYVQDLARRPLTVELVSRIKRELGLEAMAHLTCVNASREQVHGVLATLEQNGIDNVLALRGDIPDAESIVAPRESWFQSSTELACYIRENFRFCIGGAAHPETHPESPDEETDLAYARAKVEAGCEFLITQFFFTNADYFRFVERARAAGIDVPIVPGIMPVTSYKGIVRMTSLNGQSIPAALLEQLDPVQEDGVAVAEIGVAWAKRQCLELVQRGVPGIHFYTLNRSPATRQILSYLREQL
jgi:methylenetetrahydrofolate reductase (NADPH)